MKCKKVITGHCLVVRECISSPIYSEAIFSKAARYLARHPKEALDEFARLQSLIDEIEKGPSSGEQK